MAPLRFKSKEEKPSEGLESIRCRRRQALIPMLLLPVIAFLPSLQPALSQPALNRQPKPDEVGYRPRDGATVEVNPPSLVWLHEDRVKAYAVQLSKNQDLSNAMTAQGVRYNCYTHNTSLAPQRYYWRYRVNYQDGRTSEWSITRSFIIPESATIFLMPSREEQRQLVPSGHPRLFMRPEDVGKWRELARTTLTSQFTPIRQTAEKLLTAQPTLEPTIRGSIGDPATRNYWWPNREQTLKACEEAEALSFAYLMTSDRKYGEAARQWVLHLASWDPDGSTNIFLNDEAAMPILHRLPRAYDWAYETLTDSERQTVRKAMLRRGSDAYKVLQKGPHINKPFNSHNNRLWHKLAECAIALYHDAPEAEDWLDYAVNIFYSVYPTWSDDDGGWHEGLSYWAGYMVKAVWWFDVAKAALGIDGFKKPFFAKRVGDYALWIAPPGSPNEGFGDLSYGRPSSSWRAFVEYYARQARNGYWYWWTLQWQGRPETGILGFLHSTLPPIDPRPPVDLPPSKVFEGIGVASLHLTILNSSRDVHFLFKSSPYGSQSHGHNPQNSFQLNAYGESLLTTCVYRDWHGSPFHTKWCWSTRAHNAILVNEKGQIEHTSSPVGRITNWQFGSDYDYLVGNATAAYAGALKRYQRHAAFIKLRNTPTEQPNDAIIVLYDDLEATQPSTYQLMLHAPTEFALDEKNTRLEVKRPKAGATIQYLSPEKLQLSQWDGYDPPPEVTFPNQWHVKATTLKQLEQLGVLTVIVPYRDGSRVEWRAERFESPTAIAAQIQLGDRTVFVAFRKHGADVAEISGLRFTDAVNVKILRNVATVTTSTASTATQTESPASLPYQTGLALLLGTSVIVAVWIVYRIKSRRTRN